MLSFKYNSGFIALTSVIIISAVIVLLVIGIFRSSVGEMERGGAREKSDGALSLANTCAEIALYELRKNPDNYSVSEEEEISVGEKSCYISSVERESDIIIKTRGVSGDYTRKIQIEVASVKPKIEITEWREIE